MRHIDIGAKAWRFFSLLFLTRTLLWTSVCQCHEIPVNELQAVGGTWVLKSIYATHNVQGLSPIQQRELLGSTIVLDSTSLKACGKSTLITSADVYQLSAEDFLTSTKVRFGEVDINSPTIKEIVINGRQSESCFEDFPLPGQDIFAKSKDELLIYFEGVFYLAVRKEIAP